MKKVFPVLLAIVLAVAATAVGFFPRPAVRQPYAVALFALESDQVVAAQLVPGGDSFDTCNKLGVAAQKHAASDGVSLGYVCVPIPKGPAVSASARSSVPPAAPQAPVLTPGEKIA